MKKLKYISILILLLSFGTIFAQRDNSILHELSELLENNNSSSEVFYNYQDDILDINGYQVNLLYSKVRYEESVGVPMLGFICHNCPRSFAMYYPKTGEYSKNVAFPMKDKVSVYKAIKLIN